MAGRTRPIFNNFKNGELDPAMEGRTDLEAYYTSVHLLQNLICKPQGSLINRGGWHFAAMTKNYATGEAILVPFQYAELQNYALEFGDEYFRVYMDCGWVQDPVDPDIPYEKESPYLEDDLPDLWWTQGDINLYLIHPDHIPKILTRTDHNDWTITDMEFIDGPYMDEDTTISIYTDEVEVDESAILTASAPLFFEPTETSNGHVGALWKIRKGEDYGYVVITAVNSETEAVGTIKKTLPVTTEEDPSDGQSEGCWSDVNGYPRAICFDEGRLLFASTYEQPNTIWASRTRKFNDMTAGSLDDDAYSFTVSEINIIRWIAKARFLSMGALDGEATAESNEILTPTNPPTIKSQTTHGSAEVRPLRIGKAIIFLQKAQRKLREFIYNYADDAYSAPDLNILSSHIVKDGILRMVYQQEPIPIIWGINSDKDLIGCTYDRSINAVGWHRHPTDGDVQDIITIPYQNKDQVWGIIKRTINLEDRYYVEYLDDDICVDSGLTYSGEASAGPFNADHLIGKTIKIVGDDAVYPDQTVPPDGNFTIDPAASEVYAGLKFTPKVITNRPEVQAGGTIQGLQQAWNRIVVRVKDTMGLKVNGQIISARSTEDLMDTAPEPYTGDFNVENLGWDTEGRIEIEQTLPLPVHILAITGELNIGNE